MAPLDGHGGRWEVGWQPNPSQLASALDKAAGRSRRAALVQTCFVDARCLEKLRYLLARYYSTGRFGHPEQHRTISAREAALLQTFPHDYALVDPEVTLPVHKIARHIGNAVPVKLAEAIGGSILEVANVP